MLTEEEKVLIEDDVKQGYLPIRVLNPLERTANIHFVRALRRAETNHINEDDCNYPFSKEDEELRVEYNSKTHEIMDYWERRLYENQETKNPSSTTKTPSSPRNTR